MNKKVKKIYNWITEHPGYLKCGAQVVYDAIPLNIAPAGSLGDVIEALDNARLNNPGYSKKLIKTKANTVVDKKSFKRLFWDIETSYNTVATWNVGYKLNISHESILKERAIICICYKWAGDNAIHSLQWKNGDDKQLIKDFVKVISEAEESIGHNSDRFDEKWLRTRALFHGISMPHSLQTIDTLKLAKSGFRFNSNRLDYLGKFMGFGGKMDTGGFKLWLDICERNDQSSLDKMIKYCKVDVTRLEQVYDKLNPYTKSRTHVGVTLGNGKCSCVNCGSDNTYSKGKVISSMGNIQYKLQCQDCGKYFKVSKTEFDKRGK